MTDLNIDFLKRDITKLRQDEIKKKMAMYSFMGLIVFYLLGILGLFTYSFILGIKTKKIDAQVAAVQNEI